MNPNESKGIQRNPNKTKRINLISEMVHSSISKIL